jgi:glutamate synthase domain-containing protein 3
LYARAPKEISTQKDKNRAVQINGNCGGNCGAIVARGNEFEVTDAGEAAVTNGCGRDWKKHLKIKTGTWLSY